MRLHYDLPVARTRVREYTSCDRASGTPHTAGDLAGSKRRGDDDRGPGEVTRTVSVEEGEAPRRDGRANAGRDHADGGQSRTLRLSVPRRAR